MKQSKSKPLCNCKKAFLKQCAEFQHDDRDNITFKDKGTSEYQYVNKSKKHLAKYRIEGGLIPKNAEDKKADFLLLNCENKQSFFIELKGSDMLRAIDQINKSIDLLESNLTDFAFFARIVLTKTSHTDLRSLKYIQLRQRVEKRKGNLKLGTRLFKETL